MGVDLQREVILDEDSQANLGWPLQYQPPAELILLGGLGSDGYQALSPAEVSGVELGLRLSDLRPAVRVTHSPRNQGVFGGYILRTPAQAVGFVEPKSSFEAVQDWLLEQRLAPIRKQLEEEVEAEVDAWVESLPYNQGCICKSYPTHQAEDCHMHNERPMHFFGGHEFECPDAEACHEGWEQIVLHHGLDKARELWRLGG